MDKITNRILNNIGDDGLIEKLLALSKSDLNSLLLKLFHEQADTITPVDLLKSFRQNRFTVPSEIDSIAFHLLEAELLSLAQEMEIKPVLLSPAAPFASCSAFGCVDQNNVVSALRGTEILSDPTNMLAIIIAEQIRNLKLPVHYCTTARVLRAQPFPKRKGYSSHFGLFCIVSCGTCEKELFMKQLIYYKKLFVNKQLSIVLRKRSGYPDNFFENMTELVKNEFPDVPVSFDLEHEDNNYYKGINFNIHMEKDGNKIEIVDGGFVDWIQKMTGNKKLRCLISGVGLDRLL
ncbi:MAG: hypothetical protein FWF15_02745 [Oscillospiraceae bacterium]|nr:hypothetical protein [Oscillospiraceae bacterium]